MKNYTIFIVILLLITACKKFENRTVIIGYYCGECGPIACLTAYKIKGEKVYKLTGLELNSFSKNINYKKEELITDTLSKQILKIKQNLKEDALSLNQTIGEPDERDQCGIYLEIERVFYNKRINIDPDIKGQPDYLMKFVTDMKNMKIF